MPKLYKKNFFPGTRFSFSQQIGITLGIVKNRVNFIADQYKPTIVASDKKFIAGRVILQRRSDSIVIVKK